MKGSDIKEVLRTNKLQMKDIAEKMGTSLSNLSAGLSKDDVRTGLLEEISEASGIPISVFYGQAFGPVQTVGDNNSQVTQVAGNYSNAPDSNILEIMKMKDEQLLLTIKQVSKAQEQMDRVLDRFGGATSSEDPEGV